MTTDLLDWSCTDLLDWSCMHIDYGFTWLVTQCSPEEQKCNAEAQLQVELHDDCNYSADGEREREPVSQNSWIMPKKKHFFIAYSCLSRCWMWCQIM